jgi:hypothetical protein
MFALGLMSKTVIATLPASKDSRFKKSQAVGAFTNLRICGTAHHFDADMMAKRDHKKFQVAAQSPGRPDLLKSRLRRALGFERAKAGKIRHFLLNCDTSARQVLKS